MALLQPFLTAIYYGLKIGVKQFYIGEQKSFCANFCCQIRISFALAIFWQKKIAGAPTIMFL
jgi:hypothetical protein